MANYYEILGIRANASQDAIEKAYQNKIADGDNKESLDQAYEVLRNPDRRKEYNENLIQVISDEMNQMSAAILPPATSNELAQVQAIEAQYKRDKSKLSAGEIDQLRDYLTVVKDFCANSTSMMQQIIDLSSGTDKQAFIKQNDARGARHFQALKALSDLEKMANELEQQAESKKAQQPLVPPPTLVTPNVSPYQPQQKQAEKQQEPAPQQQQTQQQQVSQKKETNPQLEQQREQERQLQEQDRQRKQDQREQKRQADRQQKAEERRQLQAQREAKRAQDQQTRAQQREREKQERTQQRQNAQSQRNQERAKKQEQLPKQQQTQPKKQAKQKTERNPQREQERQRAQQQREEKRLADRQQKAEKQRQLQEQREAKRAQDKQKRTQQREREKQARTQQRQNAQSQRNQQKLAKQQQTQPKQQVKQKTESKPQRDQQRELERQQRAQERQRAHEQREQRRQAKRQQQAEQRRESQVQREAKRSQNQQTRAQQREREKQKRTQQHQNAQSQRKQQQAKPAKAANNKPSERKLNHSNIGRMQIKAAKALKRFEKCNDKNSKKAIKLFDEAVKEFNSAAFKIHEHKNQNEKAGFNERQEKISKKLDSARSQFTIKPAEHINRTTAQTELYEARRLKEEADRATNLLDKANGYLAAEKMMKAAYDKMNKKYRGGHVKFSKDAASRGLADNMNQEIIAKRQDAAKQMHASMDKLATAKQKIKLKDNPAFPDLAKARLYTNKANKAKSNPAERAKYINLANQHLAAATNIINSMPNSDKRNNATVVWHRYAKRADTFSKETKTRLTLFESIVERGTPDALAAKHALHDASREIERGENNKRYSPAEAIKKLEIAEQKLNKAIAAGTKGAGMPEFIKSMQNRLTDLQDRLQKLQVVVNDSRSTGPSRRM